MKTLLLEIGAEEIPAGYIQPALKALAANLLKKLSDSRITHGEAKTYGTPRRLTVSIADVADKQEALTTEVLGPPERIAFDDNQQPTMAATKFAEKVGVPVTDLSITETPKGKYLSAITTDAGEPTGALLSRSLPDIICATPFPKTMKWADQPVLFARPIHSILALLGTDVIPFELAGIQSNTWSRGHSIMNPGKHAITNPEAYVDILRDADVIANITERKEKTSVEITAAVEKVGGRILSDPDLLDIVTNLVEYPVPVVGNFDPAYLELPREILITAMREHQKYFAVIDETGELMPYFVALNNTRTTDPALAAKGHERVLRARLEDARFFYRTDRAVALDRWVDSLKNVLFQAKLGSVYDKVVRVGQVTEFLAEQASNDAELKSHAIRAAHLCKADLVSQAVGEFPKLQGVMGRVYALAAGEPGPVANAIEEHYQPTHSGAALPQSLAGALVAMADKIDTICGCFSVGLIPTGAADPYALRRQAIGIIQIILDQQLTFSLKKLIEKSRSLFSDKTDQDAGEIREKIMDFFTGRMTNLLLDDGYSRDVVGAVTAVSADLVPDVWARAKALETLKNAPDFEPLAIAFKRVVNIIKKAETAAGDAVEPALFEDSCETDLYTAFQTIRNQVTERLKNAEYDAALRDIASLRGPVDTFFDGVMVMAKEEKIRTNRLALLAEISALFAMFADFSKIST